MVIYAPEVSVHLVRLVHMI